jgi:hypothetical protein
MAAALSQPKSPWTETARRYVYNTELNSQPQPLASITDLPKAPKALWTGQPNVTSAPFAEQSRDTCRRQALVLGRARAAGARPPTSMLQGSLETNLSDLEDLGEA